jgi:pyruvate/2-oxoglutarate dehydrogenase complex dihydrolipoamide dehydrogenase (E3) component
MTQRYDAIIIGTGQSGPPLAANLSKQGLRVAIVERGGIGGTCVNAGCIPTKTLVGSARVAALARRAAEFGIEIQGSVGADMRVIKARKDEISGSSSRNLTSWLEGLNNVDLLRGHARFLDSKRITVDDTVFEAERIYINVGARPRVPDWPGLRSTRYLTSSTILDLDHLPTHLIIVGASYVGLEFAQIFRRFGSQVTVIETKDRMITREDEDVSNAIQKILESEGVRFRMQAECIEVLPHEEGVALSVNCQEGAKVEIGSHLLVAVGRIPNTDDLGLDNAAIEKDASGYIAVDEYLQTSAPGIWALGDVNGKGAFTHTSYNDYEIVASLLDGGHRSVSDRILCYGLFIDPPLGRAGMTEREARLSGRNVLIGKRLMSTVGRAIEFGETQGFIKILVDGNTEEILGVAILVSTPIEN